MRRPEWLLPFLLMAALGLAQATILWPLSLWGARAQLILVVLVVSGLDGGIEKGAIWGFCGGLATDLLSSSPWGAYCLALMAIGILAGLGARSVFRSHPLLPLSAIAGATLLYEATNLTILKLTGADLIFDIALGRKLLLTILQNGLAMLAIQLLLGLPSRILPSSERAI